MITTNKDKIDARHLKAIEDNLYISHNIIEINNATSSCTTVTTDAVEEAMEWAAQNYFTDAMGNWVDASDNIIHIKELKELFLNQKTKG